MNCWPATAALGDDSKMPAVAEQKFSLGQPVEIGRIGSALKALWAQADAEAMTRASLMNLAVYSEEPDSLPRNTQVIADVTQSHACRAIVIGSNPDAAENKVEAWINAHCHVGRTGAKQICSEQISLMLSGASVKLLPSILFAQLDSDLPLYLWWQGEMPETIDPQLWRWVDRLIYDSQSWHDIGTQIALVETAQRETDQRMVPCDLNWTRIVPFRNAFAQFFDHPASQHHFSEISEVEIGFADGFCSTALLFAGWIAAQLKWSEPVRVDDELMFNDPNDQRVKVLLREKSGTSLTDVRVLSGKVEFSIARASCGDLIEVGRGKPGRVVRRQLLPALAENSVSLLSEELMRGGPHRVYARAVEAVRPLL